MSHVAYAHSWLVNWIWLSTVHSLKISQPTSLRLRGRKFYPHINDKQWWRSGSRTRSLAVKTEVMMYSCTPCWSQDG